eukprot:GHVP01064028.1.p1 GENE.GHVP01064028.1~~GHVP01064028.1.p1  ORF type:complete len:104 (+),score=10.45 GHVP01064028.1:1645-1956(+)
MSITNLEYKRRIEGLLGSFKIKTMFRYIKTTENPADEYSRNFEATNKVKDPWVLKRLIQEITRKAKLSKSYERFGPARSSQRLQAQNAKIIPSALILVSAGNS